MFIIDDSMYEPNRSNNVELLARFRDHALGCYYKGFRMLTLGWSDGYTFIPVDFSLLSSVKSQVNGISEKIDKRTSGYKRRLETLKPSPNIIPERIDRALSSGVVGCQFFSFKGVTFNAFIYRAEHLFDLGIGAQKNILMLYIDLTGNS